MLKIPKLPTKRYLEQQQVQPLLGSDTEKNGRKKDHISEEKSWLKNIRD